MRCPIVRSPPLLLLLALALLPACDRRVTREAHGRFTLVQRSWTIPGPCPKTEGSSTLLGPDGEVVLEHASFHGESPNGTWSLWEGGDPYPDIPFAIDHRTDTLFPMQMMDGAHRLASFRYRRAGEHLLLVDLRPEGPLVRTLAHVGAQESEIGDLVWSPDGDALAVLADIEGPSGWTCRLSLIRDLDRPELALLEE